MIEFNVFLQIVVAVVSIVASFISGLCVAILYDKWKGKKSIKSTIRSLLADIDDLLINYEDIPNNPVIFKDDGTFDWKNIQISLPIVDYVIQSGEIKQFEKDLQIKLLELKGKKDIYISMLDRLFDLLYLTPWREKDSARRSVIEYAKSLLERKVELKKALQESKNELEKLKI